MRRKINSLIISIKLFKEIGTKQKVKIITIGIMIVGFIGLCLFPYFHPLKIHNIFSGYKYEIHANYSVITGYTGNEKEIKLPNYLGGKKVKKIGDSAFSRNTQIESVVLPKYLEEIGEWAFNRCENLQSVEWSENVKIIKKCAFVYCNNLQSVTLNEGLEEIGELAFCFDENLKEIQIPISTKKIGKNAFTESGVENVDFQNNDKLYIDVLAFHITPWLEKQKGHIIQGNQVLLAYRGAATEIVIPEGVKYINAYFRDIPNLKKIYIPRTVTFIADYAFSECKDVIVYIPESVTEIGKYTEIVDGDEKITIVTTSGSYAETYAKENGIEYEIVEEIIYPEE